MTALDRALIKVFTQPGGEPAPAASKATIAAPAAAKPPVAPISDPYSDAAPEAQPEPLVERPMLASASLASTYSSMAIDVGSGSPLNYAQAFEPDAAIQSMQNLLGSYHAEWPSVEDLYAPQVRPMPKIMAEPIEQSQLSIVAEPEEEPAPEPVAEPPSQPIPWPAPVEMPPKPVSAAPPTPTVAEIVVEQKPAAAPAAPKAKKSPAPRKPTKPAAAAPEAPAPSPAPAPAKPVVAVAPSAPAPAVAPPAPKPSSAPVVAQAPPAPTAVRPLSSFTSPAIVEPEFKPLLEVDHYTWPSICDSLETLLAGASADFSTVAESLRDRVSNGEKVIALAGCGLNAGCTTVLLCLARRLAVKGVKTVVVDADFSRPELARRLGVAAQAGWDDVLRGDLPLEEVVIHSALDQLAVAPWKQKAASGKVVANRLRAATTFGILRDAYDLVLIDAGCITNEEHAADFMQSCEAAKLSGVYLVFDGREGAIEEAGRMSDQLAAAGISVFGAIENFALMTNERSGLAVYDGN